VDVESFPVVTWLGLGVNHPPASCYTAYEDGTDIVFRNVGTQNSDAGESPRRENTTFRMAKV